ncbi:class I SAM-dependent methyltransferase [bacterium]|nr:class I SAM-dependent methyltransferase [bacterium]
MSDKPMSDIAFRIMCASLVSRNRKNPPEEILAEAGIKKGFKVLDFGCGPGSYSIAASKLVGSEGKVYALDIQPLAAKRIKSIACKNGLENIETITSNCKTGLENGSIYLVILYDILHMLKEPEKVLFEIARILKPEGTLSVSDHHMEEHEIIRIIEKDAIFNAGEETKKVINFVKNGGNNGRT